MDKATKAILAIAGIALFHFGTIVFLCFWLALGFGEAHYHHLMTPEIERAERMIKAVMAFLEFPLMTLVRGFFPNWTKENNSNGGFILVWYFNSVLWALCLYFLATRILKRVRARRAK